MRLQQPQLPAAPNDKFLGDLVFKVKSILTGIVNAVNGKAASGANSDITSLTGLTTALTVAQGGTGAITATAARTSLGAAASGSNSDITALAGLTTALSVAQGGTGQLTANAAADALGAYRRGTILGTVSQAAGVPTGAVIERGSNANGEYVRFADGTQICTAAQSASVAANTVQGFSFTFAAAFASVPVVTPQVSVAAFTLDVAYGMEGLSLAGLTVFVQNRSTTEARSVSAGIHAVGRWY